MKNIWKRSTAAGMTAFMLASAMALPAGGVSAETPEPAAAQSVTVSMNPNHIIQEDFLGVGVNVIPTGLMDGTTRQGYTQAHFEIDRKRINTVEPKVARVWFQIDWMEPQKGVYTWDSSEMLAFYQYLDAFKEAGTEIELNMGWKIGSKVHDWFNIPGVDPWTSAPADLDAYAASTSALLQELIHERGYDNVKYLTFYNEPNGSWDFEAPGDQQAYYAEMVRKVSQRLSTDGLREQIEIWGPEETGALGWTQYMKDHADDVIDGYSFHVYGESYEGLGKAFADRKAYVGTKPVHLTEFGWADDNASNWDAGYANSVIQAANSGVKSALVWQLNGVWSPDPYGGTNGVYTMWDSVVLGLDVRKTFYITGMLNRYIPEHSQVLEVDTDSPDVRAAAFRSADGEYTILLETKAGAAKDVTFDFGSLNIGKTFRKLNFQDNVVKEGNGLLPRVTASFAADTDFRDAGIDGNYNVAVYTTDAPETQVAVAPLNPTVKSGDKVQLTSEVIDNTGGVTWSIVGKNNGAINKNTGAYHAPQVDDERYIAIRATSNSDPSSYGVVLVKVLPKSVPNKVEVPTFSLKSGVYPSAEALSLETATAGAQIRYTTDGSTPTESSPLYTRPIILKNASLALYKAKAFKQGMKPSGYQSALYQINDVSNAPDGYEFCMYEGGECYFEGEAIVAFGADGLFNYGVFENGVTCSAEFFGDPNPGADKRCFVSFDIPEEMPVVTFYNAGFEKPATTSAKPGPMTNGWVFNSRTGVQHNNGPFQATPAPQGVQTGYVKTDGGVSGVLSQSINFKPGTYQMEFKAAKRTSFGGTQTFDVYFDDMVIGSYAPTSGEYATYRTEPFATDGGRHTITFAATTTTGDNTAFIDDVRITLPKPDEAPHIANASFESPAATDEDRLVTGVTSGWTFSAASGALRNSSPLGQPSAPFGVQAGLLQSTDGEPGQFSQTVEFPAGTYAIGFRAANKDAAQPQSFEVYVGEQLVGTYSPQASVYGSYQTEFFTVETGSYDVKFVAAASSGEGAAYIDAVTIERITIPEFPQLANAGFEAPTITNTSGVIGSGDGWTFNERAGIQRNGSAFGASDAPEGTQSALLQTNGGIAGVISQSLVFPAGAYALQFQSAKRTSFGGQQSFYVYLDDQLLGAYTPDSGAYQSYKTDGFTIAKPSKHTIRFKAATTTGDNTAFIDAVTIVPYTAPTGPVIPNGSFESPAVTAANGVKIGGTAEGWSFNTYSGIVRNGSVFGQKPAPSGMQAAYLNTNGGQGTISRTLDLPDGTFAITFQAARRDFGGQQQFDVLIDDTLIGSFAPGTSTYAAYTTDAFTVEAGQHTLRFVATTTSGDNTAFIDQVTIGDPVPQAAPILANAGFESPKVTSVRGNMTDGWVFNANAGVQRNGSAFGAAPAPEGEQTGLLQNKDGKIGQFSQTLFFPKGTYTISFQAAKRGGYNSLQTIEVRAGDAVIGTFAPDTVEFQTYATEPFEVPSGRSLTIAFVGTATTGDSTAFVDAANIAKLN
ncbi:hypothetical protein FHS18_003123 [Paenibacillus phyllosphaerae]|uniref:GH29D-like beta-sandwich domain-containing protein n=1 Tax=Paenibacillus phyllosphaerae TaxID=274593 RepID=A0A7W5FN90_9BACL|nr:chitobiase/beta-hexosaminidase C-terminal domain-containing protein [Paenibacillus phyllosphaerae]MBB3111055.1 hypothetical protein [Paenibacillus phyllosphaerae]